MASELGTAVVAETDLARLAAIGIAIGAVAFLLGKHLVGSLVKAMWLVAALAVGQVIIANNQLLLAMLETGKSAFAGPNNDAFLCELYARKNAASDLDCGTDLKGTIQSDD